MLVCSFFLLGCPSPKPQPMPKAEGFAFYHQVNGPYLTRGVSPEGVMLQVSKKENYPAKADLDFWEKAVHKYVPQKGYRIIKKGETSRGRYFVFLVPGKEYDYFYLVHFRIQGKNLVLIESGGRYAHLKEYEKRILDFAAGWKEAKQ
jgi:hypothetical protein